jgi:hypothetical protein
MTRDFDNKKKINTDFLDVEKTVRPSLAQGLASHNLRAIALPLFFLT